MSDPCVWAMGDQQVLRSNRYFEGKEWAKAFEAPVITAFNETPIHKEKCPLTKDAGALQQG
jgi:hypothetical protein